jgi:hypothetical protein
MICLSIESTYIYKYSNEITQADILDTKVNYATMELYPIEPLDP